MSTQALWGGLLCCALACGSKAKHDAADAGAMPPSHAHDAGFDASAHDAGAVDAGPLFDAGSAPDRNHVQPGAVCARLAEIQCAGEATCCDAPARDLSTCQGDLEQSCMTNLLLDDISASDAVGFDPDVASTAFSELEHRASMCDPSVAAWAASTDGFLSSFSGTRVKGESCKPDGGLSASASALTIALVSCQLAAGVACLPSDSGWTCEPRMGPGSRCFIDLNCGDGLFCANPTTKFDGMCQERMAEGATCRGATECVSFICKDGKCAAENDIQAAYCL
jgi:hypothetical protein